MQGSGRKLDIFLTEMASYLHKSRNVEQTEWKQRYGRVKKSSMRWDANRPEAPRDYRRLAIYGPQAPLVFKHPGVFKHPEAPAGLESAFPPNLQRIWMLHVIP